MKYQCYCYLQSALSIDIESIKWLRCKDECNVFNKRVLRVERQRGQNDIPITVYLLLHNTPFFKC